MSNVLKIGKTKVDIKDAISGPKMAGYLRQIADTIESSDKVFIGRLQLAVAEPVPPEKEKRI